MATDTKYGRVTTEHGTIGEDEPVVVFRSMDRLLPKVLKVYRIMCELAGSPEHHLAAIDRAVATREGVAVRAPVAHAEQRRVHGTRRRALGRYLGRLSGGDPREGAWRWRR